VQCEKISTARAPDDAQEQRNEKTDTSVGIPTMQLRDAAQDRARDRRRAFWTSLTINDTPIFA
jgi:hypothetical protein